MSTPITTTSIVVVPTITATSTVGASSLSPPSSTSLPGRNSTSSNSTTPNDDSNTIPVQLTPRSDALLEPVNGKRFISAWLDYTRDRPTAFNSRMGISASCFHFAMDLPPVANGIPPFNLLDDTKSNAALFLTVFPKRGLSIVTDSHLQFLVKLCGSFNSRGRRVFLRFAPDMNAPWNAWGQDPIRYITIWKRLANLLRDPLTTPSANLTALVWSPYEGSGYPFLSTASVSVNTSTNYRLLDTNGDGIFDSKDHPYEPYYPGEQYVDWVGLSVYFRGLAYPWVDNAIPAANTFVNIINGTSLPSSANFYQRYVIDQKKPMMISETGAVSRLPTDPSTTPFFPGPKPLETKLSWWRQFITNTTFFALFPRVKMFNLFEFIVPDKNDVLLDYSMSNESFGVLQAFSSDFSSVREYYSLSTGFDGITWNPVDVLPDGLWTPPDSHGPSSPSWAFSLLVIAPLIGVLSWFGYSVYRKNQHRRARERRRRAREVSQRGGTSLHGGDESATGGDGMTFPRRGGGSGTLPWDLVTTSSSSSFSQQSDDYEQGNRGRRRSSQRRSSRFRTSWLGFRKQQNVSLEQVDETATIVNDGSDDDAGSSTGFGTGNRRHRGHGNLAGETDTMDEEAFHAIMEIVDGDTPSGEQQSPVGDHTQPSEMVMVAGSSSSSMYPFSQYEQHQQHVQTAHDDSQRNVEETHSDRADVELVVNSSNQTPNEDRVSVSSLAPAHTDTTTSTLATIDEMTTANAQTDSSSSFSQGHLPVIATVASETTITTTSSSSFPSSSENNSHLSSVTVTSTEQATSSST